VHHVGSFVWLTHMIFSHKYSSFKVTVLLKFKYALEYRLWCVSLFHLSSAFCGSAVL